MPTQLRRSSSAPEKEESQPSTPGVSIVAFSALSHIKEPKTEIQHLFLACSIDCNLQTYSILQKKLVTIICGMELILEKYPFAWLLANENYVCVISILN